jgi:hypothetical protein
MERWGLADINGKIVIYQNTMRLGYKGYLIPQAPVKPKFSPTHLGWISTEKSEKK